MTVHAFPDRGGSGFRAKGKWGQYDPTNVYLPIRTKPKMVRVEESFSAAMIIAQAILAQLTPEQKRAAQSAAHKFAADFPTDEARAASAFMVSI